MAPVSAASVRRRSPIILLEADQPVERPRPVAARAADVVLAGGEQQGGGREVAAARRQCPAGDLPHRHAAGDLHPARRGVVEQRRVEPPPRQAEGGEGQPRLGIAAGRDQSHAVDAVAAETAGGEPQRREVRLRLGRDEVAAHLVVPPLGPLEQQRPPPALGQQRRRRRSGQPAAGNDDPAVGGGGPLQPPDAQAEGEHARTSRRRDAGVGQRPVPVGRDKAARDRHRPVVADEPMPAHQLGQRGEAVEGDRRAAQVVDEPAARAVRLHPAQKGPHLAVVQVVGDQRTDDEVDRFGGGEGEDVAGAEVDAERRVGRRPCGGRARRVEIDADQPRAEPAPRRPAVDRAQHVALAVADVEQGEGAAARPARRRPRQPGAASAAAPA